MSSCLSTASGDEFEEVVEGWRPGNFIDSHRKNDLHGCPLHVLLSKCVDKQHTNTMSILTGLKQLKTRIFS